MFAQLRVQSFSISIMLDNTSYWIFTTLFPSFLPSLLCSLHCPLVSVQSALQCGVADNEEEGCGGWR